MKSGAIMVTKPGFLVAKEEMLVSFQIVSSLATISDAILSLGMAIKILYLVKGFSGGHL